LQLRLADLNQTQYFRLIRERYGITIRLPNELCWNIINIYNDL